MINLTNEYQQPGYLQPGTTVVVVQQNQPQTWYSSRVRPFGNRWGYRGPQYMRHGITLGGIALSFPIVVCLGLFGGVLLFAGVMMISTANYNQDFWDKFDRSGDPTVTVGSIVIVVGALLVCGAVALGCYAKKKYKQNWNSADNPGRVINQNPNVNPQQQQVNPGQPSGVPPYGMNPGTPMAGGYTQPPVGSYPPSPGGQPTGYPPPGGQPTGYPPPGGQPTGYPPPGGQPTGYPPPGGQPTGYPPPTAAPAEKVPPYSSSAPDYSAAYPPPGQAPPPSGTGMPDDPTKPFLPEYGTPSAYAPGPEYGTPSAYAPGYQPNY